MPKPIYMSVFIALVGFAPLAVGESGEWNNQQGTNPAGSESYQQPVERESIAASPQAVTERRAPVRAPAHPSYRHYAYGDRRSGKSRSHGVVRGTHKEKGTKISLTPMVGTSDYVGRWRNHITNRYAFGLALGGDVSKHVGLELEGAYSSYWISYLGYQHAFNQYGIGGNGKFYLLRGTFNPYVGVGVMGLLYENMTRGPRNPIQYNQWVGAGQALIGGDVKVSESISVGVRAAFLKPMFGLPQTAHNGVYAFPFYEEAAAMNTSLWKLMGAVKVEL